LADVLGPAAREARRAGVFAPATASPGAATGASAAWTPLGSDAALVGGGVIGGGVVGGVAGPAVVEGEIVEVVVVEPDTQRSVGVATDNPGQRLIQPSPDAVVPCVRLAAIV
jgi:hypothetical protein